MPRAWYREYFTDHPAYTDGNSSLDVFTGNGRTRDKVKVWCTECYNAHLGQVMPPALLQADRSDPARLELEYRLWNEPGATWIPSRRNACLLHLRDCPRQPNELRDRAASLHERYLERRRGRDKSLREARRPSTQSESAHTPVSNDTHASGSSEADYANTTRAQLPMARPDYNDDVASGYTYPTEIVSNNPRNPTIYPNIRDVDFAPTQHTPLYHNSCFMPYSPADALVSPHHPGAQTFAEVPCSPPPLDYTYDVHMDQETPYQFSPAPYPMWTNSLH